MAKKVKSTDNWSFAKVHERDNFQYYMKRRTPEEVLSGIKAKVLNYFAVQERYSIVRSEDGESLVVLEEGRGVVDSWHLRQVDWVQRLIKEREIEEAKEKHRANQEEAALERAATYRPGMQVTFPFGEGWYEVYFEQFAGRYNEKAKVRVERHTFDSEDGVDTFTNSEWVWTEDLKPYQQ